MDPPCQRLQGQAQPPAGMTEKGEMDSRLLLPGMAEWENDGELKGL